MLQDFIHFLRSNLPILLMPPAGMLWLLLLGAVLGRFAPRAGRIVAGTGFGVLFILSMPAVGGSLIASLEHVQPQPPDTPPPGAIIVLGADGDRTREEPTRATPGPLSLQRLTAGAQIARKTNLPVLITGGSVGAKQPPVADMMADLSAEAYGVPVTYRELQAGNTCENARFSAAMLRKAGIPAAYVVTNAWHMPRAVLSFARAGYPVIPVPVHPDAVEIRGLSDFLPHTNAWLRSYFAIHEWIGLIAYRLGACPPSADPAP